VVLNEIDKACADVSKRRRVSVKIELINADTPAQCDAAVIGALTRACHAHRLQFQTMVSRAYHDSLFMSRIAPTAMLFIPCRGGVSHRPDEYASAQAIADGVLVLAEALAELASV
jgi:ureidoglycolate amidohydrolase